MGGSLATVKDRIYCQPGIEAEKVIVIDCVDVVFQWMYIECFHFSLSALTSVIISFGSYSFSYY